MPQPPQKRGKKHTSAEAPIANGDCIYVNIDHRQFGFHLWINIEAIWTLISFALLLSSWRTLLQTRRVGSSEKSQKSLNLKRFSLFT